MLDFRSVHNFGTQRILFDLISRTEPVSKSAVVLKVQRTEIFYFCVVE